MPVSVPSRPRYDVVVIGAGLAGLTAAAHLARSGVHVLVCEQAPRVGGLFGSFWREGYLFDGGIKAIENADVILPTLAELGVLERVRLAPSPIAILAQDRLWPMRGREDVVAYFRWLETLYPAESSGLERILRDTLAVYGLLDGLLSYPIPALHHGGDPREARAAWFRQHRGGVGGLPHALPLLGQSLRVYLGRHLGSPSLINFLAGLFPEGTTAFFGLAYWRLFLDYAYPREGIQAVPDALATRITELGGEIRLRAPVTQVLLEHGRAAGVRLASGEEISAGAVIAANALRQTLLDLVPAGSLPPRLERSVRSAGFSHTAFHVFVGLDIPPDRLPFEGYPHVYYLPDLEGISAEDRLTRPDYFEHVPQELSVPCLHNESLAPPGCSGLVISCMTSWRYGGGWGQPGEGYAALKQRAMQDLLASLSRVIPELNRHTRLCFAGTPRTILAETGNSEGAIMGWAWEKGAGLKRGSFLRIKQSVQTPVPGLLVAGHWAWSPGGSPIAVITARIAADQVLKGARSMVDAG